MSEAEPIVTLREPREDRAEIAVRTLVALTDNTRKRGNVVALPRPSDQNRMVTVLFEDEDNPREGRMADLRAVAGTVQLRPEGGVLVVYYDTGISADGTPGRLGVLLYGTGNVSLVYDGWPVGGAEDILPKYLRRFGRQGEHAEAAALWALGRLCLTESSIFADHALSRSALRQFASARAAEAWGLEGPSD